LSPSDDLTTLACDDPQKLEDISFLRRLQEERPVVEVRTPAGDKAWLITRYDEIRALLFDRRIGRSHPDPANAPKYYASPMFDKLINTDYDNEPEENANLRAMIAPYFTRRKLEALRPKLSPLVAEAIARLIEHGPPADAQEFSRSLAAQVLGEQIGIPREDRAMLVPLVHQIANVADPQSAKSGADAIMCQMRAAAAQKRAEPGEDVMSGLMRNGHTDDEAANVGAMLVFAGLSSTTDFTASGIARIAGDLEMRDRLIANPELMASATDEFFRKDNGNHTMPRYAREDIEIADVTIRAGDLILLNYGLANNDERVFTAPDELDITRSPNPHLTFSHGMFYCLGAPLARVHLVMTFKALLAALPTLRLAKPLEDMDRTTETLGGRFGELLVTW
jgi:cytochrome P450 monooxygenase